MNRAATVRERFPFDCSGGRNFGVTAPSRSRLCSRIHPCRTNGTAHPGEPGIGGARLKVQGRDCDEEVLALPEGRHVLLGQVPLEKMDWWIDLAERRLVANPEHGGQWMAEVF